MSTKKGEDPDVPLHEFAMWYINHDYSPGDPQYHAYMVSLTSLATMANVSATTIRNWLGRPGFPKRDQDGLVDGYAVWKWKSERDLKLPRRRN